MRKSAYAKEFLDFRRAFDRCYRRRLYREIRLPRMAAGRISVVLPVYNGARYLDEAIQSVLAQSYTRWELLIVDDGSTDESFAIAKDYANRDGRIHLIRSAHQKLPGALNTGFAEAIGEFYTWTSADNRMAPDCLEKLVRYLLRHPKTDMVYGNMQLLDADGRILRGQGWYEIPPLSGNVCLPKNTLELNTYANNTIGAAFLYRAQAAAAVGAYAPKWFTMEDYDFFMRMNAVGRIEHLPEKKPLYFYRMHEEALTAKDAELGITARRPQLMELDKQRRGQLVRPLFYHLVGEDRRDLMRFVPSRDASPVACGIAFDSAVLPEGEIKVYIADQAQELPSGFDLYLSYSEKAGCPWSSEPEVLGQFLDVYCRGNCTNK